MQWRIRIAGVWDDLRDSPWLLPTVVVAAAAALAGLLIASAVFDVIVPSTVRSSGEGVEPFVPRLAVTPALILAGAAADRSRLPDQEPPVPDGDTVAVVARREGYLQLVDAPNLARSLRDAGCRLRLRPTVREWVSRGTTLAWAWVDGSDTRACRDDLDDTVHRGVHLGADRTESSDLTFGIRQLQDIALRALSTGINDPSTASIMITQLASILVYMADEPLGAELLTDVPERVADRGDRADAVRHQLDRLLASTDLPDADDAAVLEQAARLVTDTLRSGSRPVTAAPTRAS